MSELLKINVNDHTEQKNGLTYLSWAWAWAEVLKVDAQATWVAHEFGPDGCQVPMMILPDTTAMVKVGVTIKSNYKQCLLPVMDHRNKAIPAPNAFQVNTAIMRCLAKAISMHGLGLYIYAGEDLPEVVEVAPVKHKPVPQVDLAPEDLAHVQAVVNDIVTAYETGAEIEAIAVWYGKESFKDNDERIKAWELLGPYSKIRSLLKANKPELKAA